MVNNGQMPHPRRLSPRRIAWDVKELDAAVDRLPTDKTDTCLDDSWSDVDAA
jgi:predicted DNA-binding transcriptional regulator AlpA